LAITEPVAGSSASSSAMLTPAESVSCGASANRTIGVKVERSP
jgi:hypothetical protein